MEEDGVENHDEEEEVEEDDEENHDDEDKQTDVGIGMKDSKVIIGITILLLSANKINISW